MNFEKIMIMVFFSAAFVRAIQTEAEEEATMMEMAKVKHQTVAQQLHTLSFLLGSVINLGCDQILQGKV